MPSIKSDLHGSAQQDDAPGTRSLDCFDDEGGPGSGDACGRGDEESISTPARGRVAVDGGKLVVTPGAMRGTCRVHHHDIPELHADGGTEREAAANLARELAKEIEWVGVGSHREQFTRALADVRAFAEGP